MVASESTSRNKALLGSFFTPMIFGGSHWSSNELEFLIAWFALESMSASKRLTISWFDAFGALSIRVC